MATKYQFGNKQIGEPGAYSQIKSGIKNPPLGLSFGALLIIDNGKGASFGGGAGIKGTLSKNKEAIQSFDNIGDFRDQVRGGLFWHLAEYLFRPNGIGFPGISNLFFIKAAETVPAEITYEFGDYSASDSDSDSILDGGNIIFQVRNEGLAGNGVEVNSVLTRGYAAVIKQGPNTAVGLRTAVIEFWAGTFKGNDTNGIAWDDILEENTTPELLVTSLEFSNIEDLGKWALKNSEFNKYFKLKEYSILGSGRIDANDVADNAGNRLAVGGTEVYGTQRLDEVLDAVKDLDYNFVLADDFGVDGVTGATSSNNGKIWAHIVEEAKFQKYMVVGGGDDQDEFDSSGGSVSIANYYNSSRVIVVHAGIKRIKKTGGYKDYQSITKAAAVAGRILGLEPQVPGTFKSIAMDADRHVMTEKQRQKALDNGVLHTKFDDEFGRFIINQSINSNQENDFEVNEDGSSHEISIERITGHLNKLIVFNAKRQLLNQANGVNRNTLTVENVKQWLKGFLSTVTATTLKDNLILSSQNINVEVKGDAYFITYEFVPNFPVNKLFFTGVMIDNNLSA